MASGDGELARHGLADGEERLLQSDQKERQSQQDARQPDGHPPQIGQAATQHDDLEQDQNDDDGRHVEYGGPNGCAQRVQKCSHWVTMP